MSGRLEFLESRDGIGPTVDFAIRTARLYRNAILDSSRFSMSHKLEMRKDLYKMLQWINKKSPEEMTPIEHCIAEVDMEWGRGKGDETADSTEAELAELRRSHEALKKLERYWDGRDTDDLPYQNRIQFAKYSKPSTHINVFATDLDGEAVFMGSGETLIEAIEALEEK